MKPTPKLRRFLLLLAASSLLAICSASGQTLFWDADGNTTAATGGTGNWLDANTWRETSATGTLGNWVDGRAVELRGTAGTVTIAGTIEVGNFLTGTAGYLITGGSMGITGTRTFTAGTGTTTIESNITGTGGIFRNGSGTLTLSGTNSYSGETSLSTSETTFSGSNSSSGTTLVGSARMILNSNSNGGIASGIVTLGNSSARVSATNADRSITNEIYLTADNAAFDGSFSISTGDLSLRGAGRTLFNSITGDGKTLTTTGITSDNNARNFRLRGNGTTIVTGAVALGTGQLLVGLAGSGETNHLILNGTNTYTGATSVLTGTLTINGTTSTSSAFTVSTGATLKGRGAIGGTVTVNAGGILASGNSIESLGMGTLSLANGSFFQYEIDRSAELGVDGDLTAITGNLNITNGAILTISDLGLTGSWDLGTKLTLMSYSGSWNGGLFTYDSQTLNNGDSFNFAGAMWEFLYNDTVAGSNFTSDLTWDGTGSGGGFVTMTVIPEPAAAFLGSLGLLFLLRRRR